MKQKWLVTAFPRKPHTQEVFADAGDEAITAALAHPGEWLQPTPPDDRVDWSLYAMPFDEPTPARAIHVARTQPPPPNIADTCCGKCPGPCYVDQITGA